MLAVLCLVCAWFWGPLVFPKDADKVKPSKTGTAVTAAAPTSAIGVPEAKPAAAAPVFDWKALAASIAADTRMTAVAARESTDAASPPRSPFRSAKPVVSTSDEIDQLAAMAEALGIFETPEGATESPTDEVVDIEDWRQMPLSLSSTMVGLRTSKAVINGRPFREGATIGLLGDLEIRLQRVTPRSALLVWNGTARELRIPKPGETPPTEQPLDDDKAAQEATGEPSAVGAEGETGGNL